MSRRDQIRMTDAEIAAFLDEQKVMSVATIGKDGRPHVVAMWFSMFDGVPCFWTFTKSQKIVNLKRDPRLTCMIEAGGTYNELRGVELIATADMTDDEDEVLRFGVVEWEKYQGIKVTDALLPAVKKMANKRTIVKLRIERIVSWDHRKLGGAY